ncbi:hypothetical protein GW17_00009951 [Ensete ventricosum]|nr:hypothetical protein GW17_00009951 [Ensete ventricosum]
MVGDDRRGLPTRAGIGMDLARAARPSAARVVAQSPWNEEGRALHPIAVRVPLESRQEWKPHVGRLS